MIKIDTILFKKMISHARLVARNESEYGMIEIAPDGIHIRMSLNDRVVGFHSIIPSDAYTIIDAVNVLPAKIYLDFEALDLILDSYNSFSSITIDFLHESTSVGIGYLVLRAKSLGGDGFNDRLRFECKIKESSKLYHSKKYGHIIDINKFINQSICLDISLKQFIDGVSLFHHNNCNKIYVNFASFGEKFLSLRSALDSEFPVVKLKFDMVILEEPSCVGEVASHYDVDLLWRILNPIYGFDPHAKLYVGSNTPLILKATSKHRDSKMEITAIIAPLIS